MVSLDVVPGISYQKYDRWNGNKKGYQPGGTHPMHDGVQQF